MVGLLDRRILFVFGKGGVGKSVVSGALGIGAADRGLRAVVAEMNGAEAMASLFGREPVGYEGGTLAPGLSGLSITPAAAIEEYLVRTLKFRLLYETVFRNRFVAPLMDGVLGLSDLISVGKVLDLEWLRTDGSFGPESTGEHRWDVIVIDGPATGHGLSMLRSPQAMMELAKVGPLYRNARDIRDLFAHRGRFAVVLATLAEEMPVSEALQALDSIRDEAIDIEVAAVIVNSVPPPLFRDAEEAERWPAIREEGVVLGGRAARAILDAERTLAEYERAQVQIRRLRDGVDVPVIELPRLPGRDLGPTELRLLAAALGDSL